MNNFAPRLGVAYQITNKLVMRAGYGIFYGGDENGPYSDPSPGFNPPFFVTQSYSVPCFLSSANPALGRRLFDSWPQHSRAGFPSNALTNPNTPLLFAVSPNLRTPYTQQWHFGFQYQLPGRACSRFPTPDRMGATSITITTAIRPCRIRLLHHCAEHTGQLPNGPRRPAKICDNTVFPPNCNGVFDTAVNQLRSDGYSNYSSLQVRWEKNFSHGLQFQASYTYAHAWMTPRVRISDL